MLRDDTTSAKDAWLSRIRVRRILGAAIMSEAGVIAMLLLAVAVYVRLTPGITDSEYAELGERIGYYVAPPAGMLTTFLSVLWAARTLRSTFVLHGLLVAAISALLTALFMAGARPEYRLMYGVAIVLRLIGGVLGGFFARWRHTSFVRQSHQVNTTVQEQAR